MVGEENLTETVELILIVFVVSNSLWGKDVFAEIGVSTSLDKISFKKSNQKIKGLL